MPSTVGIVASGEDVLNDAVFWVDAGHSSVVSGALSNLGTGGSALNAVFGNSTGVDSFDPALLAHTGTNYLHLPGVTGNYASTPDAAALDITGDIEIVVRVSLADWTPAETYLVSKYLTTTDQRSYAMGVAASGRIFLRNSADGVTTIYRDSSAVPGLTDGVTYWLKATLDVDNGLNQNSARFYYATDQTSEPLAWTEIGSAVTTTSPTSTTTSIFQGSSQLDVGSLNAGVSALATGSVYRAIVRNGIGGTTVFDADFTTGITSGAQTTFTESSANAATVTINRSTSGRKAVAVTRSILLFGTDDYLEVADNDLLDFAASDPFTVAWIGRQWTSTAGSFRTMIAKMSSLGATQGWAVMGSTLDQSTQFRTRDASAQVLAGSLTNTAGSRLALIATRNGNVHTLNKAENGGAVSQATTTSTALDLANATTVRLGANTTAGQVWEGELVAAAVWRRALNANEIATIVARYT